MSKVGNKEETVIIHNKLTGKKIEVRKRVLPLFQMVGGDMITVLGEEPPKTKKMQVQAVAVPETAEPEAAKAENKRIAAVSDNTAETTDDSKKAKSGPKRIDQ